MPLNWDASELPNLPWADQSEEQRDRTANLAWVCMAVGYRSITESNWKEFYARYCFYRRIAGDLGRYEAIDIYQRIGFSTNCSEEIATKWYKRLTSNFISDQLAWASREEERIKEEVTA